MVSCSARRRSVQLACIYQAYGPCSTSPGVLAQPYLTASLQGNPRSCMKFWESLTDINVETCCSNPRKNWVGSISSGTTAVLAPLSGEGLAAHLEPSYFKGSPQTSSINLTWDLQRSQTSPHTPAAPKHNTHTASRSAFHQDLQAVGPHRVQALVI